MRFSTAVDTAARACAVPTICGTNGSRALSVAPPSTT